MENGWKIWLAQDVVAEVGQLAVLVYPMERIPRSLNRQR